MAALVLLLPEDDDVVALEDDDGDVLWISRAGVARNENGVGLVVREDDVREGLAEPARGGPDAVVVVVLDGRPATPPRCRRGREDRRRFVEGPFAKDDDVLRRGGRGFGALLHERGPGLREDLPSERRHAAPYGLEHLGRPRQEAHVGRVEGRRRRPEDRQRQPRLHQVSHVAHVRAHLLSHSLTTGSSQSE
eukprot:CAMPEP_0118901904 /NCGR_PEP_ID=MMETSP1166-20130328/7429_1 /TAXON_ID=1104430 /ORGANISM="Chrysoreinhardia sp, Strain CCMP3193" /LENGTH=191 /DNA_ID=CAMNT_0006841095 /DNA_START=333 /DNA_END=908 /DNA_ORIENTATION=+